MKRSLRDIPSAVSIRANNCRFCHESISAYLAGGFDSVEDMLAHLATSLSESRQAIVDEQVRQARIACPPLILK